MTLDMTLAGDARKTGSEISRLFLMRGVIDATICCAKFARLGLMNVDDPRCDKKPHSICHLPHKQPHGT